VLNEGLLAWTGWQAAVAYSPRTWLRVLKERMLRISFLRRKGYTVVARRWSPGHQPGDLDLIAWQGELLCIVEVKSRTAHDMTPAEAAVDTHKRKMMRRLARQYVRQLPMEVPPQVRFDVISVYLIPGQTREFVHFEAAFGWSEMGERF
jgi:putative endonuclease